MAARPARLRSPRHPLDPSADRWRLFLGRAAEIRLPQPGRRPVHQIRIPPTRAHGAFRGGIGDPRRSAPVAGFVHPDHGALLHRGNDRSHLIHQDRRLPGNQSAPASTRPAQNRFLGRPARDTFRLRPAAHRYLSAAGRTRRVVARPAAVRKKRDKLRA